MTGEEENRPDLCEASQNSTQIIDNDMFVVLNTYAFVGWCESNRPETEDEIIDIINNKPDKYAELARQFSEDVMRETHERKQRRANNDLS